VVWQAVKKGFLPAHTHGLHESGCCRSCSISLCRCERPFCCVVIAAEPLTAWVCCVVLPVVCCCTAAIILSDSGPCRCRCGGDRRKNGAQDVETHHR